MCHCPAEAEFRYLWRQCEVHVKYVYSRFRYFISIFNKEAYIYIYICVCVCVICMGFSGFFP